MIWTWLVILSSLWSTTQELMYNFNFITAYSCYSFSLSLLPPSLPPSPLSHPPSSQELSSVVEFPQQMTELRSILKQVDDFHKVRQRLTAEMADNSGVIRNLIVRAEDARLMNDM